MVEEQHGNAEQLIYLIFSMHDNPILLIYTQAMQKKFIQYPSHRIFGYMHGALNAVEKIINYKV